MSNLRQLWLALLALVIWAVPYEPFLAPVQAAVTVFLDNCTEPTTNTALDAHTPDTGTGWTEVIDSAGTNQVTVLQASDTCSPANSVPSASLAYTAAASPALSSADYTVSIVVIDVSTVAAGNDDPTMLLARYTDTSNYYAGGFYAGTLNLAKIWKMVGGTGFEIASGAMTPQVGDTISFVLAGTSLAVKQNGVTRASVTDSDLSSTGTAGIGFGALAELDMDDIHTTDTDFDVFTVVDDVASAGAGRPGDLLLLGIGR